MIAKSTPKLPLLLKSDMWFQSWLELEVEGKMGIEMFLEVKKKIVF